MSDIAPGKEYTAPIVMHSTCAVANAYIGEANTLSAVIALDATCKLTSAELRLHDGVTRGGIAKFVGIPVGAISPDALSLARFPLVADVPLQITHGRGYFPAVLVVDYDTRAQVPVNILHTSTEQLTITAAMNVNAIIQLR